MITESDYYDHYKDTFEQQKGYLKERNRLTLYLVLIVSVIFLLSSNRVLIMDVSSVIQKQKIGKIIVDFNIITSALYFAFLWISMRYYQITLTIEKTYTYIAKCEKVMSATGEFKIDREGGDYEKNYPWLKWLAHRIYVIIFPLLIVIASIVTIVQECGLDKTNRLLNIIFLTLVILLSLLYMVNRFFGK